MQRNLIVSGIGTGVGKTIVSAILTEALEADYWKPIQAGNLDYSDRSIVKSLVSNSQSHFHPEAYSLQFCYSPHYAAQLENRVLKSTSISLPLTKKSLVIEGCGGICTPLNSTHLIVDILQQWKCEWVVVSRHYLGSINHTLLTIDILRQRQQHIIGIIFNGTDTFGAEEYILHYTRLPCLGRLCLEPHLNPLTIKRYACLWKPNFCQ